MLRHDDLVLKQLEQRVAEVKKANDERTRLAQARAHDVRQQFYDRVRADDARAQQEVERLNREGAGGNKFLRPSSNASAPITLRSRASGRSWKPCSNLHPRCTDVDNL